MDIKMLAQAKPILFSTPMVQAILDGRKAQTRRVIKTPPCEVHISGDSISVTKPRKFPDEYCRFHPYHEHLPGDILWVRETWKCTGTFGDRGYEVEFTDGARVQFNFDDVSRANKWAKYRDKKGWQSPYFMPREAARLFLHIKNVMVGQLQDITVEDCIAEGIECDNDIKNPDPTTHESIRNWNLSYAQFLYKELWDKLNAKRDGGKYAWDMNPWVWVYTFERIAGQ